jgi:hypothetical protein
LLLVRIVLIGVELGNRLRGVAFVMRFCVVAIVPGNRDPDFREPRVIPVRAAALAPIGNPAESGPLVLFHLALLARHPVPPSMTKWHVPASAASAYSIRHNLSRAGSHPIESSTIWISASVVRGLRRTMRATGSLGKRVGMTKAMAASSKRADQAS